MGTELRTSKPPSPIGAEVGGRIPEEEDHAGHLREQDASNIHS